MNVVAMVGTVAFTAVLLLPAVIWAPSCGATSNADADRDAAKNKVVVEASLAARKTPKKQPQKEFQAPTPVDKPQGVSRDENKETKAQCCVSEADCNKVSLAFPTTCPDDGRCDNNRCKAKKQDTSDPKDKPVVIPDRTGGVDQPVGNPTDSQIGQFDGSKKGRAATNSGHPWLRELANDFLTYVDFPSIEEASAASACLRIEKDGTIAATTLDPPTGKRSDNEGLNAKAESAFKKITEDRKQKPQPVPTELLEQVVTKWQCIPIDAQAKQ